MDSINNDLENTYLYFSGELDNINQLLDGIIGQEYRNYLMRKREYHIVVLNLIEKEIKARSLCDENNQ